MTRFQWARVSSLTGPATATPALLNMKSRCPWSCAVRSTSAATASASVTSRATPDTRPGGPAANVSAASLTPAFVDVGQDHGGAAPRQRARQRLADPRGRPGDDGHTPLEMSAERPRVEPRPGTRVGPRAGAGPVPGVASPTPTVTPMVATTGRCGPLALVGGGEWSDGCDFDVELLAASGGDEVLVLPTAAAYEHPDKAVATAEAWFARIGGRARGLMVLGRADAEDEANAAEVRASRFVYLGGGSPMHLRSVLKASPVWEALLDAWRHGAVVAGSSAGAMVLTDPMVDPRGGALTVGLGMVAGAGRDPALRRRERREGPSVDRPGRARGSPSWASPSAPRSSVTPTAGGARRGRAKRRCS